MCADSEGVNGVFVFLETWGFFSPLVLIILIDRLTENRGNTSPLITVRPSYLQGLHPVVLGAD